MRPELMGIMSMRRRMPRAVAACLVALTLVSVTSPSAARAAVPVLVLDGTGYGHGVGLSQWGAEYLARTGRSSGQILATFYPGASIGRATGIVRVVVHQPPVSTATLAFPQGGEVRSPMEGAQAPGFPLRVAPGGRVRVTFDGRYRAEPLVVAQSSSRATRFQEEPCALPIACTPPTAPEPHTTTTTTPPPSSPPSTGAPQDGDHRTPPASSGAASSSSPVWALPSEGGVTTVDDRGRSYRGAIEATGGSALRLVNVVGIEDYLRGMAEVPGTWPAAAIEAQTIAARTYALRGMQGGGELCDDARCQVYVGRTGESAGEDAAVFSTAGTVLTYRGSLASAVYSADAGGVSATTFEGFGTPDGVYPYLTTVRYQTDNPLPWQLEVALTDVAARLAYRGTLTGVHVDATGPSGRALQLVLTGSAGDLAVDGRTFARSLGLRSTRFTAALGTSDGAPPPPPPAEEHLQAPPDEAASLARQPVARPRSTPDRFESRMTALTPAALAESLDPRRNLLVLVALLMLAALTGAHLPVLLATGVTVADVRARVRAVRRLAAPTRLLAKRS